MFWSVVKEFLQAIYRRLRIWLDATLVWQVYPHSAPVTEGFNVFDAGSYAHWAYAHPWVFGNFFESFSINESVFSVSGTSTKYGDAGFFFLIHSIFTILEPSGKGSPLSGMPSLYALIIVR